MKNVGCRLAYWRSISAAVLILAGLLLSGGEASARDLTLQQALDLAVDQSARGGIIKGNFEVADQKYRAKRINFYLPEISINGSIPAYNEDETYRLFGAATTKQLYNTRELSWRSFIRLKQSLITGGDLEVTANLRKSSERYPLIGSSDGVFIDEDNQQGYFELSYAQPLLKPSEPRNDLYNRRDEREIALYTRFEEVTTLRTEVTEAYMGLLRAQLALDVASDKAEKATLAADIDSIKFSDGVISEEDLLESQSARLDAQLEQFEAEIDAGESQRELAMLLDLDVNEPFTLVVPEDMLAMASETRAQYEREWENTVAIKKAEYQYKKARRAADYAVGTHGLNGDLALTYSFGKEDVNRDIGSVAFEDDINTNSWGVSLNFTYPLWDGGSSSAEVQASQFQAEQARLEFKQARQSAQAEIANLLNRLDVSSQRLDIVRKQIELAASKLDIAETRLADGQISQLTYLESRVFYLETKDRYYEELKDYLVNRIALEGKFAI